MSRIIETTVYQLDELDASARERARDWFRRDAIDEDWYEFRFADFVSVCAILGISLSTKSVRLMGGGSRAAPKIYFSGFSSQGDGACYEGGYRFARDSVGRLRAYAPQDADLHAIANRLLDVQRRNFYQLRAEIRHAGRYCDEYSMQIAVRRESATGQDMSDADEEIVIDALRDLARWLYRQLEAEYDFITADQQIDEAIRANGYSFTEDGHRFG
ncbi:antitoxin of toxin-antitoxin stability system [Sphingobium rhizovicinum]|uniref:Antitoxin of toxin-antitoxin stability system n=1 Tax=Sphingobium rhizovicinum TaxID=432308 RepID=A0ABV7NKI7_9SPHN